MIKIETADMSDLKENLQVVMRHLLDLLREILASVHEERIAMGSDDMSYIRDVLMKRQDLLEVFDEYYQDFVKFLHSMAGDLAVNFSLAEGLEWLQIHLEAEDLELLLLSEQLARVGQEMQAETKALISFLEHKSAFGLSLNSYFTKISPKPVRVPVGLVDDNDEA